MRFILCGFWIIACMTLVVWADDHGDSSLTATPTEADGRLVAGCIEEAGDMDFFLFSAVAGRVYRLMASHQSAEMASVVYLFDSDGQTILAVDHDAGDGDDARIQWKSPADGTYFVMVRHARSADGTGCYELSISLSLPDDHGDDALSATPLQVGADAQAGFIETEIDEDAFLFSVDAGYSYEMELVRTSGEGTLTLTRLDADGITVLDHLVMDRDVLTLTRSATDAGVWFVTVAQQAASTATGYELRVSRPGYGDDFGNDLPSAVDLDAEGFGTVGAIEVADDADWFRFEAREDNDYRFSLRPQVETVRLTLSLRGPSGDVILQEEAARRGDEISIEWTAPEGGVYFLEIASADGVGGYALGVESTLQLEAVGHLNPSGYSLDVWARDSVAYLVVGTKGLLILDTSDPTDPVEIGSHSTRGYAQAVAAVDSIALVANRGDGLTVLDLSDPTRPVEVGSLDTPGSTQDVATNGEWVVVADQRGGIHAVAVDASGHPTLLSTYETSGYAAAAAIQGKTVYVAVGDAGIEIVDLSDPTSPVGLGRLDLVGDAHDVAAHGSILYVAAGYRGVRIVDVAEPTQPTEVGWISTSGEVVGLHLVGSYLYVAERTAGVSVYALADPLAPERIAEIDTPGEALSVFVAGGYAYVADREEGLQIVRILP